MVTADPTVTEAGLAGFDVIVEVPAEAVPATKLTDAVAPLIATVLIVPVMLAVAALADDCSVREYVPSPLSWTVFVNVPADVARVTVAPPVVTLLPNASFAW